MKRLVNRLSGACLYVLLALIVGMSSCEDDANDWTVNKNYDALFRPLTFDKSATDATSVTLRYSQIVNAKVYIFEFYFGLLGQSLNRRVQGEGHFLLRVLRGGSH